MAVANAQQQSQKRQQATPSARLLRKRRELLEELLKQQAVPSHEALVDLDRQYGEGTALWLLDEMAHALQLPPAQRLTQLQSAPLSHGPAQVQDALDANEALLAGHHRAQDVGELEARLSELKETPGNEAEIAQVQAALTEAEEAKKHGWHAPDKPQATLVEKKREGFDNAALRTRGQSVGQNTTSETRSAAQRGLDIDVARTETRAHDEQIAPGTNAHVVEQKALQAGGGTRSVQNTTTVTTRGDARTLQKVAEAEEKLEKAEKARKAGENGHGVTAAAVRKAEQHDFRVAATEKAWSTRTEADEMQTLAKGVYGSVKGNLDGPSASAKVGGTATVGVANGIGLTGNVSAKVVAFEGGLKYTTPELEFAVLGEKLRGVAEVAFKAEALAEAKGQIKLNILAKADGLDIDIGGRATGASGSVEAFAGLRAGVDAALKLDWLKKPDYFAELREQLLDFFQKTVGLPGGRLASWALEKAGSTLFGQAGWVNVVKASAGMEGSAGIGGSAAFDAAIGGGRVKFSAKLKGTIGLGFGGKAAIDASILEGLRLLAVLTAKGGPALAEGLGLSASRLVEPAKQALMVLL